MLHAKKTGKRNQAVCDSDGAPRQKDNGREKEKQKEKAKEKDEITEKYK